MTSHYDCRHCGQPIAVGTAFLRSRGLRRVAFHGECLAVQRRLAELARAVRDGIAA